MRAQHYNPNTLKGTQADPLYRLNHKSSLNIYTIRQTANLYAYVANNPIMFIDPSGMTLRHFAESAGGSVNSWNATTRTATVTVNGITNQFTDGHNGIFIDRNGVMQISLSAFNAAFRLGTNSVSHAPIAGTPSSTSPAPNSSANRVVVQNHGSFTANSSAFQVNTNNTLLPPRLGIDAHAVNVNISPNNTGNFNVSGGITAISGTADVTLERNKMQATAGASLVSGEVSGSANIGPISIRATCTLRLGLEYGFNANWGDGEFKGGFSKGFFSFSAGVTMRD